MLLPYVLIILGLCPCEAIFSNALKKLKQKSKEAYKKKFGKDKTWHFLGFDLTEYPGTNEKYRQLNKDKWGDYYACLEEQNSNVGHDFSVTPEAVQVVESGSVRLECKLCLSPLEIAKIDSVEWFWAGGETAKLKPVEYTENILLSPTDRSLDIYNLHKEQTGQYICRLGKAESAPYFLTVIEPQDEDLREVHSLEAPTGPYPQKPEAIPGYNLIVDTEWTPWTSCSKCDQIGRRHRLGYCIVKYEKNAAKYITPSNNTNTTEDETVTITDEHYEFLRIFKFGIPCTSHVLPHSLKKLRHVTDRKNEIMTGFCKIKCPEDKVFEVRDKDGNVIERANNSAGIYSMVQGIPSLQPSVERLLQFGEKGKKIVVACPGNLNTDVPVQWQIGTKKLVPELLVAESKGRVYVSITDKIHIKDAKISDSNIYSCWQHKDLAGTVRLIVEKKISLNFNHHIMLIGAVLIFSLILYVFAKAFFRRKIVRTAT
ncbi:uncharacterized protein LOC103314839 [Tribolium castaneum]|uniref:uncharacterized protein LOC103314839 n=1 Tax=Tribolium castaneum TaxID=7070 RepID=UPI0030FE11BA